MNNNCISKCYAANTKKLHPLYLIPVSSKKPFCLINNNKHYESCNPGDDEVDDMDHFIPQIGINESYILNHVYNISCWKNLTSFLKKNNKLIQYTADRIFKFSWISFYESYKSNTDDIIELYNIYLNRYYKDSNINISKIIYSIKKININNNLIHEHIERSIISNN